MAAAGATRVALLATDGVERIELEEPRRALREAGFDTVLISDRSGGISTFDHLEPSTVEHVDLGLDEADAQEFDGLLLPGGVANPDALRRNRAAVAFVRSFFETGKPVGAICHAPWLLIEAGVATGRSLTSWPSLRTDLVNAGADWMDRDVVRDGNLVTSRGPDDLPAFTAAVVELLRMEPGGRDLDDALDESFPASDPPSSSGPTLSR